MIRRILAIGAAVGALAGCGAAQTTQPPQAPVQAQERAHTGTAAGSPVYVISPREWVPNYAACVGGHVLDMTPQQYAAASPEARAQADACEAWNAAQAALWTATGGQ